MPLHWHGVGACPVCCGSGVAAQAQAMPMHVLMHCRGMAWAQAGNHGVVLGTGPHQRQLPSAAMRLVLALPSLSR